MRFVECQTVDSDWIRTFDKNHCYTFINCCYKLYLYISLCHFNLLLEIIGVVHNLTNLNPFQIKMLCARFNWICTIRYTNQIQGQFLLWMDKMSWDQASKRKVMTIWDALSTFSHSLHFKWTHFSLRNFVICNYMHMQHKWEKYTPFSSFICDGGLTSKYPRESVFTRESLS